jgi:hypothetical protein
MNYTNLARKFTAKEYRPYLVESKARFARLVGQRNLSPADRDDIENRRITALSIMRGAQSVGERSFRAWFNRDGFCTAFASPGRSSTQKRWARHWQRLFDLVISLIDLWPDAVPIDCPVDPPGYKPISGAKRAALAKARAARWTKVAHPSTVEDRARSQELGNNKRTATPNAAGNRNGQDLTVCRNGRANDCSHSTDAALK